MIDKDQSQVLADAADKVSHVLDVAIGLLEEIQGVISGGRPKALKVKFGDKVVTELPIDFTAGAAFAAGLLAVLLAKLTIEIVHE